MKTVLISAFVISLAAVPAFATIQDVRGVSPEVAATLTPSQLAQIKIVNEEEATTLQIKQRIKAIIDKG
ncbi:MAG: hypothetical protein AAFY59_02415 [Pseudomonadota bacterium]